MSDSISFGRFGKAFQEGLCQLVLEDRPFADRFLEVFNENYLELKYLRTFAALIIDYRSEYNLHPGYTALSTMITTGLDHQPGVIREQVESFYRRIQAEPVNSKN